MRNGFWYSYYKENNSNKHLASESAKVLGYNQFNITIRRYFKNVGLF